MRMTILTALLSFAAVPGFAFTTLVTSPSGQLLAGEGVVTARSFTTEERFNGTADTTTCVSPNGLGIDLVGGAGDVYDLANDTVINRRNAPSGDSSCYLTLGSARLSDNLEVDFTSNPATPLTYLGFYWGSLDAYNGIAFFNASGVVDFAGGLGNQLTGDVVASLTGGTIGGSQFVEFDFDPADQVTYAYLSSTNYAFELDNVAYTLDSPQNFARVSVFEPVSFTLFALGVALCGAVRRRI